MTPDCVPSPESLSGVILAGGLSRRMAGREKAFLDLGGATLLARMIELLRGQLAALAINANGDAGRFAACNMRVMPDLRTGSMGPLAGIETALTCMAAPWVCVVPVDLPFLPQDLTQRLCLAADDPAQPVTVVSAGRLHPTVCLWPRQLLPEISLALDAGRLALGVWLADHPHRVVEFICREGAPDPFFNINTPEDLVTARRWLERGFGGS
ncbi:MAG: molybdenum cofactor guanylyltransferase [Magnetococcales bacterium]|nr:molybdenum cofactor guanylyltransferase [Magnetococcales bacterium]